MKKFLGKWFCGIFTAAAILFAGCSVDSGDSPSPKTGNIETVIISGVSSEISYNATLTLKAVPTFSEGATVTASKYEWTLTGSGASLNKTDAESVTLVANNGDSSEKEVSVKVKVTDSNGTSKKSGTYHISISATGVEVKNEVTHVEIKGANSITSDGSTVLVASVTKTGNPSISYSWEITAGADYATLGTNGSEKITLKGKNTTSDSQTVKLKLTVGSVSSDEYTVTVGAKGATVSDFTAELADATKSWTEGDIVLASDIKVTVTYSDGTSKVISSGYTLSNATLKAGSNSVEVTYNGSKKTVTITAAPEVQPDITNAEVEIVKSEGLFNSAYIIFKQLDGAKSYKVYADDVALDEPLIRYYDTYKYNEYSETDGKWTETTLSSVVRADALGLKAGSHTLKVCATNSNGDTGFSAVTLTVKDYDRSGFAFTGAKTPGAYNLDGTLKSGAIVIYLTHANKKTLTAKIGSTEYTGIQNITQAIKSKNTGTTPVDIRIVGTVIAESNDLSCADHKSSYALGVKGASQVTIEGVGHDASLFGAGVAAFQSEYIEISNLGLIKWGGGKDGDGVSLKTDDYAWVHNNDVFYGDAGSDADQAKGDGSMDMKDDSKHVTVSYNHFWDSGKMSLCGMKSESGPNYITYHHNWFDHSDSRHPRIRTMTVHVYNNYFDGNAKYGVGVTTGSSCFVEGNYFRNANDPMMSSKQGTDARGSGTFSGEKGGIIKSWNNFYTGNKNWASEEGSKDPSGRTLQFITNKYDYTNNTELGEYREWTETIGTQNADGTWTIYDSVITNSENTIATNSLIAVEDASIKGAYYQGSKGKTMFYLDVPKNASKIVIKAKTGSSSSGATTTLTVNGVTSEAIGNSAYSDFEFAISGLTADSTIEVTNSGSNSLNVSEIKLIAATGWETLLSEGADLKNIDAYEVDSRSETVPDTVVTKSGGTKYSNFDTEMGDLGLGLTSIPTDPISAKTVVVTCSGRHNPDYAWNFDNSVDDASYALNEPLNTELKAYKTCMVKIQGTTVNSSSVTPDPENPDTPTPDTPTTPSETGATTISFTKSASSDSRLTYNTAKSYGTAQTYNGTSYSYGAKLNSSGTVTLTLDASYKVTFVMGTDKSGYSKGLTVDGSVVAPSSNTVTATLAAGKHTITNGGSETSVFLVILATE